MFESELSAINFTYWIYQTVAMLLTCLALPRLKVNGVIPALVTVIALAFVNAHLWSAALFFEIPDSLTHRTIVLLIANGLLFWVVVKILPGIEIQGVFTAIAAPIIFTVLSVIIGRYGDTVNWNAVWQSTKEVAIEAKAHIAGFRENLEQPASAPAAPVDHYRLITPTPD